MRRSRGAVSVDAARSLGISDQALSRAVANGEVDRTRRRVYTPPGMPRGFFDHLAADITSCERHAVLSHSCALEVVGIRPSWLKLKREILVAGTALPLIRGGVVVHRTVRLDPADVWSMEGFRATRPARTLIDLYPTLGPVRRLDLLDHLACSKWCSAAHIHPRAAQLWPGRAGVKGLADLTGPGGAARFRSRLERLGLELVRTAGVVDPQVNVVPKDAPGAGLTDVVSEADRLIIDWDGLRFHAGPKARQRDNDKANASALGGYLSLRFTWKDQQIRSDYVSSTIARARQRPRR